MTPLLCRASQIVVGLGAPESTLLSGCPEAPHHSSTTSDSPVLGRRIASTVVALSNLMVLPALSTLLTKLEVPTRSKRNVLIQCGRVSRLRDIEPSMHSYYSVEVCLSILCPFVKSEQEGWRMDSPPQPDVGMRVGLTIRTYPRAWWMPAERRGRWRTMLAKPPKERGDCAAPASPTCIHDRETQTMKMLPSL